MSNGHYFYQSSLSHLVESLVHLPDVPWAQVSRVLHLCPRVDSPSISLRQQIAVCATADYYTRSGGRHHEHLSGYLLGLLKNLPNLTWNVSHSQVVQNGEYVGYTLAKKVASTVLEMNTRDSTVTPAVISVAQQLLSVYNCTETALSDADAHLNFIGPTLLGLLDGITEHLATTKSALLLDFTVNCVSRILQVDSFSGMCERWLGLVDQPATAHSMTSFPYQLLTTLVKQLRMQMDSLSEDQDRLEDLFKSFQKFIEAVNSKLYPKSKPPNSVTRSNHVTTDSIKALCECLDVTTLLAGENCVFQHYQSLNAIFNTTVALKTPDLFRVPLQVCCVRNIGELTVRFPLFAEDAIEIYKQTLFGPSPNLAQLHVASCMDSVPSRGEMYKQGSEFQRTSYVRRSNRPRPENPYKTQLATLRKAIISSLIAVLSAVHPSNPQTCQGFVGTASNQLVTGGGQDSQMVVSTNAVSVLGAIATNLSDIEIVKMVIQIFRHKVCNPPSYLDTQMIKQLGEIMVSGEDEVFTEVRNLFMQISSKAFPDSKGVKDITEHNGYRQCSFTVIRTLEDICGRIENPRRLQEMLGWLLELFVQRSVEVQKICERENSPLKDKAANIGVFLPVFDVLMKRIDKVEHVTTKLQRLFRDFWQICVVMNFVTRGIAGMGHCNDEWYEGVVSVARKTPIMSSMGADTHLQHDLQYNSALKHAGVAETEYRDTIHAVLHSQDLSGVIDRLNYGQCTFFLSAYHIELMRVYQPSFTCYHLFDYLQDKGIQKDKSGIYACFEQMCTQVFQQHISNISLQSRDERRQLLLVNLVQFLLVKFNHVTKKIRWLADKWLSMLIDKFNHLLWSEGILNCLAHLTEELKKAANRSNAEVIREVAVPYKPGTMMLADEVQDRREYLYQFCHRFSDILQQSLKFAPLEKLEMVQGFAEQLKQVAKEHNITLDKLNVQEERLIQQQRYYNTAQNQANRNKFYGHIEGMKSLEHFQGKDFNFVPMILEKMDTILGEWRDNPSWDNKNKVEEAIHHTSAFLISEPTLNRKLLRALARIPVVCLTSESVRIAANCWEWTVAQRPEFESHLLMEIIAAWRWTVNARVGLFAPTVLPTRPVNTDSKVQEPDKAPDCEPHRIWIRFLTQRFEVIKYKSSSQVELFTSLFHSTLPLTTHHGSVLCNHISALGPRFEFLNLGLLLLQNDIIRSPSSSAGPSKGDTWVVLEMYDDNELNQSILRERIYTAILDYFCVVAQWPGGETPAQVLENVETLNKFWDTLFHDKKYLKSVLVPTTISPETVLQVGNGYLGANMLSIDGGNSPSLRSRSLSVERSKANSVAMKKNSKGVDYKSKYHLKKRNLILFLINHEIERLFTWAQPTTENIPNSEKKVNFVYKNFTERTWSDYMHLAWSCSPMIALALALRVRSSDAIARTFRLFIKSAPVNFYNSVEAIPFLAGILNVKNDLPQLVHLLAWQPASPLEALTYFTKEYDDNPISGMFALQSIKSHPCEMCLFLVPQIVQAIRHDTYGYVKQIIRWIASISPIVTHQLIWNMKANMYLDEEATCIDPLIGETLDSFITEISNTMSAEYREFYNREFNFFNTVTEISSIIKPFPKGPERRTECLRALKQITVNRFGTYLPSNPDAVIVGIDYTSGRPMQSAAKAPFLATFRVKSCEVSEMQNYDTSKADLSIGVTSKSCIFKEGDDLRQDILALQIIEFFSRAFKSVGLDVFLKPYRVVATAPGSGVIEVVPNSKTRDELGKKTGETLYNYFIATHGDESSETFRAARENFVKSMAGYSIVTWLLQIKDRHNANIMIDNIGNIIHIDFGFLFESSPGGNMGFEPDIKLTPEMVDIMGGGPDSAPFKRFVDLVVRGFLAVRPYCESICTLVSLMMESNLPCFRDDALRKLRNRFQPNVSDRDAAIHAKKMIHNCMGNMRTAGYDRIQAWQNNIAH